MEREIALRMTGVSKKYRLGKIGATTLQADLQSWWARVRKKQDPNEKIGKKQVCGDEFMALKDIDLTVYKGETLGVIGINGAGKSTLLKLLSRITAPTTGEIELFGRVSSILEVGAGFHGEMTGRENIYLNGAILGMSKKEIDEKLPDIIAFSEIEQFIDTPVKRYSSGMYVKLAFAVAAHLCGEIMIMDEVLAVGDAAFREKCLQKLKREATEEGRTVLFVSHNMSAVKQLCSRCIVLSQGKIIFDGDTQKAISVYMNGASSENTRQDLSLCPRSTAPTAVKMLSLCVSDRATLSYRSEDDFNFSLTVESEHSEENVCVRLTFRTESDEGIGTSFSTPFSLKQGRNTIEVELPLRSVQKGVFFISLGVYQKSAGGTLQALDHVTRAMKIEVDGSPLWSNTAYGYLSLPTAQACVSDEEKS